MLRVFLCEDDPRWLKRLEAIVTDYIAFTDYDMKLELATHNPAKLLNHLQQQPAVAGMYILDVNLQHELNGIDLAAKLRQLDTIGKIVFVTTHGEMAYLTFRHRVEALDYITKDQPEKIIEKVQSCIDIVWQRYQDGFLEKPRFKVKTGSEVQNIDYEKIMFFVSHASQPHKLVLHTDNGRLEFYGTLSEVAESSPDFYRCHQSYVVNIKNVRRVDKAQRIVEMTNGEAATVTPRKIKTLLKAIAE